MNIFRSLIGKVWQDPNAAEVVKISQGELYLVRNETIRSDRECIYNDAMATIRRVPALDHNFQLVITRVYEEGDQELLEDEDETDEERVFLISEELEFRTGTTEGEPTFIWRDIEGDVNEFYEFVATGTNEPTRAFFETCMYRAMYERKYKVNPDTITEPQLEEFIWKERSSKKAKGKAKAKEARRSTSSSHRSQGSASASSPPASQEPEPEPEPDVEPEAEAVLEPEPVRKLLPYHNPKTQIFASAAGVLYLHDRERNYFVEQDHVYGQIVQRIGGPQFEYWLVAGNGDNCLLTHRINADMNQNIARTIHSLTWNNVDSQGIAKSWCLAFQKEEDYEPFIAVLTKALWETAHQYPWEKAKADEQMYAMSANEDVEMRDVEDDSDDEEDEVLDELDKEDDSEPEEDDPEEDEDMPQLPQGEKNSQLAVGYKGNRSYVIRGNNIGVFSHNGEQVRYHATISKVATPKGKAIKPKQVMLHEQDSKMIVMDDSNPNSLFELDLERGKIVEEWKINENIPVKHIAPENKFAQMTPEHTLVGASGNALFRIDPRVAGDKLVDSQYKQYSGKNKFSGVTTTASGKLAVASEKGDIRLFDSIGKNAKTALPPLGDPIVGIDVTADGRWIVATTKTYLLLIDTLIGDGRWAGSFGFDKSFPADSKPVPRRLQLRPEHVAYMGHAVSFTPARFNTGESATETSIVTSTGEFVVAWDFAKVKKGHLDKYDIKKYEDHVVQDNFKFGDDKEIIVAMENNVLAVNKKALKRPTRASLSSPLRNRQSKSGIVNSPF